jgi:hypothetical protein
MSVLIGAPYDKDTQKNLERFQGSAPTASGNSVNSLAASLLVESARIPSYNKYVKTPEYDPT